MRDDNEGFCEYGAKIEGSKEYVDSTDRLIEGYVEAVLPEF